MSERKQIDPDMIKINQLTGDESLRLAALFREQVLKPEGYSIDRIAYTEAMQKIADVLQKEYPTRGWNVRRAYLSLMAFRKAGLMDRALRPNASRAKKEVIVVLSEDGQ